MGRAASRRPPPAPRAVPRQPRVLARRAPSPPGAGRRIVVGAIRETRDRPAVGERRSSARRSRRASPAPIALTTGGRARAAAAHMPRRLRRRERAEPGPATTFGRDPRPRASSGGIRTPPRRPVAHCASSTPAGPSRSSPRVRTPSPVRDLRPSSHSSVEPHEHRSRSSSAGARRGCHARPRRSA